MKKKVTIYIEEEFDRGLMILLHRFHDQLDKKISKSAMIERLIVTLLDMQDEFFELNKGE